MDNNASQKQIDDSPSFPSNNKSETAPPRKKDKVNFPPFFLFYPYTNEKENDFLNAIEERFPFIKGKRHDVSEYFDDHKKVKKALKELSTYPLFIQLDKKSKEEKPNYKILTNDSKYIISMTNYQFSSKPKSLIQKYSKRFQNGALNLQNYTNYFFDNVREFNFEETFFTIIYFAFLWSHKENVEITSIDLRNNNILYSSYVNSFDWPLYFPKLTSIDFRDNPLNGQKPNLNYKFQQQCDFLPFGKNTIQQTKPQENKAFDQKSERENKVFNQKSERGNKAFDQKSDKRNKVFNQKSERENKAFDQKSDKRNKVFNQKSGMRENFPIEYLNEKADKSNELISTSLSKRITESPPPEPKQETKQDQKKSVDPEKLRIIFSTAINLNLFAHAAHPFITRYVSALRDEIYGISRFYHEKSTFSMTVDPKYISSLSEFSKYSRNLIFRSSNTKFVGSKSIQNILSSLFPNGLFSIIQSCSIADFSCSLCGVVLHGVFTNDEPSMNKDVDFYRYDRSIIVLYQNGEMFILNDHINIHPFDDDYLQKLRAQIPQF